MANPTSDVSWDQQIFYVKECPNESNRKTASNIIKNGHSTKPPCRFCIMKSVPCIKTDGTRRCALCAAKGRSQKACEEGKETRLKRPISQVESPDQQPVRSTRDITPLKAIPEEKSKGPLEATNVLKPSISPKKNSPRTSTRHSTSSESSDSPVRSPSAGPSTSRQPPSPAGPAVVAAPGMDLAKQFEKLAEELKKKLDKQFSEVSRELDELRSELEAWKQKKPEPPDIIGALLGNCQNVSLKLELSRTHG